MRVALRTPTDLIVRDSATTLRSFGAFIAALALFVVWVGLHGDSRGRIGGVPLAIGVLLLCGGVALLLLPARKTFSFSKTERTLVIVSKGLARMQVQTHKLRDIADVVLEESRSREDGPTYRVALTLADQRRVPWTSYYTSGYAAKRAVVEQVREFLGFAPDPDLGTGGMSARTHGEARSARKILLAMAAFCCAFLVVGTRMLWKEQRRLTTFRPIEATVVDRRVVEHRDSDGSTYEPVVEYRYIVGDRFYTANGVTPLRESRSSVWAYDIIGRFTIGGAYTAWYDPQSPGEAYLLRTRSIVAPAFIAIPLVGLLLISAGLRGVAVRQRR